jgi:FtsH-binding integral membrane protein
MDKKGNHKIRTILAVVFAVLFGLTLSLSLLAYKSDT